MTQDDFIEWVQTQVKESYRPPQHKHDFQTWQEKYRYMAATFEADDERESLSQDDYIGMYLSGTAPNFSTVHRTNCYFVSKLEECMEEDGKINLGMLDELMDRINQFEFVTRT